MKTITKEQNNNMKVFTFLLTNQAHFFCYEIWFECCLPCRCCWFFSSKNYFDYLHRIKYTYHSVNKEKERKKPCIYVLIRAHTLAYLPLTHRKYACMHEMHAENLLTTNEYIRVKKKLWSLILCLSYSIWQLSFVSPICILHSVLRCMFLYRDENSNWVCRSVLITLNILECCCVLVFSAISAIISLTLSLFISPSLSSLSIYWLSDRWYEWFFVFLLFWIGS